jgi:DNA-binding transcriptional LysR family regulator
LDYCFPITTNLACDTQAALARRITPDSQNLRMNRCDHFLADRSAASNQILGICRHRGYIPKKQQPFLPGDAILLSVGAGAGISFLPRELVQETPLGNLTCIPISGDDAS